MLVIVTAGRTSSIQWVRVGSPRALRLRRGPASRVARIRRRRRNSPPRRRSVGSSRPAAARRRTPIRSRDTPRRSAVRTLIGSWTPIHRDLVSPLVQAMLGSVGHARRSSRVSVPAGDRSRRYRDIRRATHSSGDAVRLESATDGLVATPESTRSRTRFHSVGNSLMIVMASPSITVVSSSLACETVVRTRYRESPSSSMISHSAVTVSPISTGAWNSRSCER